MSSPNSESIAKPNHMQLSLDQATYWARQGLMTTGEFAAYRHAWQTGAPRFSVQACHCATCRADSVYPRDSRED